MNGTEIRSFSHFQILTKNRILGPKEKFLKLTNFGVSLHSL